MSHENLREETRPARGEGAYWQTLPSAVNCVRMAVCRGKDVERMPPSIIDAERLAHEVWSG